MTNDQHLALELEREKRKSEIIRRLATEVNTYHAFVA